jgi:hypothetical protein
LSAIERLDFVLPDFTRLSWTDEVARSIWAPRIQRIQRAFGELEWLSVAQGVRRAARLRLTPEELVTSAARWAERDLASLALGLEANQGLPYSSTPAPPRPGRPVLVTVAVGKLPDTLELRRAWDAGNHEAMGELLGYPACCRRFFRDVWVEGGSVDPTWAEARRTAGDDAASLEIHAGTIAINPLWRWAGVRDVPHLPCRFDCIESARLAGALREVAVSAGFAEEAAWTSEILSWPVEWSALHGIAEIKTPIFKIATRTDATASKLVVRLTGRSYPAEGAQAVRFPYRTPARALFSEAPSFQRGLDNLISLQAPRPEWYHVDNGFSSRHGMDIQQRPLVELARDALDRVEGAVLDLGCGNAALLEKICRGRPGTIPYGVDVNPVALAHARELLPHAAENFVAGDLFTWTGTRRHALALLMVGRLLEGAGPRAAALLAAIGASCDRLIVYVYDGWSRDSLETLGGRAGLRWAAPPGARAGLVALPG